MTAAVSRRYLREFIPAMTGYVVVLLASVHALRAVDSPLARAAIALLPVIPIGFAARALLRFVRDSDELQRRIQLEAFALASLVLTLGAFSLGLLGRAVLQPLDGATVLIWILPLYALLYGVFAAVTSRRYQ
ncbi:hypothetical protein [Marilutibacter alkalisoli]|uniref:Uncharacterized protein n=1 Tax=Marilutibacter alkalisoli TaxID=2591633 RepID=A0A514BWB6_9GAMM|nr:hypothetical protein [Lysobacter alkalisoli]QDH71605.1 hypothetical protein FKV23_17020 [Lysobacter alkalisoli]